MKAQTIAPRRIRGFSLIELLLVLGVVAALMLAAFVVYPKVQASNQAKQLTELTLSLQAAVRTLYASKASYQGLTTSVANRARMFPQSLNRGNYTTSYIYTSIGTRVIVNAYGSPASATITPGGAIPANQSFYIRYYSVPPDVCVRLVTNMANKVEGIRVGGSYVLKADGLHVPTLAVACSPASGVPPHVYFWSS